MELPPKLKALPLNKLAATIAARKHKGWAFSGSLALTYYRISSAKIESELALDFEAAIKKYEIYLY